MDRRAALAFIGSVASGAYMPARADDAAYPNRVVTMVIPYASGGQIDTFSRALADRLRGELGQTFIVESRAGAGGAIGSVAVARAKPDGYTLLIGATGSMLITPFAMRNAGFDPIRDFEPIAQLMRQAMVFAVSRDFPAQTLREAVALIKANPGKFTYASAGSGALAHLGMEYLAAQAGGLKLTHVPYKGGAPAMTDLLGGHVPMMLQDLYQAAGPHKAGQLRVLAVMADQRSPLLPDVPTAAEQGLPGLAIDTQFMLAAPAGTPAPVLGVLSRAVTKILATPDFGVWAKERGFELIQGSTPESTAQFIRKESTRWSEVIKAVDLKL